MKIYYLGKTLFFTIVWAAVLIVLVLHTDRWSELQHTVTLIAVCGLGIFAGSSLAALKNACEKEQRDAPSS